MIGAALTACAISTSASAQNKACVLMLPFERDAIAGAKVSSWTPEEHLAPGLHGCRGQAGTTLVKVRYNENDTDPKGEVLKAGIELIRKEGHSVEVKQFGAISCMTTTISRGERKRFINECIARKPPAVAVATVTTDEPLALEKLAQLAQRMATRF